MNNHNLHTGSQTDNIQDQNLAKMESKITQCQSNKKSTCQSNLMMTMMQIQCQNQQLKSHNKYHHTSSASDWRPDKTSQTLVKVHNLVGKRSSSKCLTYYLAVISLVLVSHIFSNNSFLVRQSAGKNVSALDGGRNAKLIVTPGLISLASASPGPEPSSAGSRTHRIPPMNGSIFGKRSVNQQPQQQQQQQKQASSEGISHNGNNKSPLLKVISQQPSHAFIRSRATNYQDIITKIIEDFLALNNESDPEEASVAFCRMIVYECSQMLSERHKAQRRRTTVAHGKPSKVKQSQQQQY